ncbi:MAG TPA: hypothetical protein VLT61_14740 [Anaeromyxobacteraceae bacterium]|nr:hypothetical protein [Anaeromyxobacteraceae bacterium]
MTAVARLWSAMLAASALALAACGSDSSSEPIPPPGAPTGLVATAADRAVSLTWNGVAGATSYNVYGSDTAGLAPSPATKVGSGIAAAEFNAPAANGTTWYFRVTAVNAGGESPASDEVSALPDAALLPAAPMGVTATAGDGSVTVAWDEVPAATTYRVYYATLPGVTTGAAYQACASPCTISSLANRTAYYFAVSAFISAEESALSTEVMETPRVLPYIDASAIMYPPNAGYGLGMGSYSVQVCTDAFCGTPITSATVTLGGVALAYDSADEEYTGEPTASIAGRRLDLVVTIPAGTAVASGTYRASGTMYTQSPAITSPANGATWLASTSHSFTWTPGAPTTDSMYAIAAVNTNTFSMDLLGQASPPSTSYPVSAYALTTGPHMGVVMIGPAGSGISIPGAQSGSEMNLIASSQYVMFTVQ